MPDSSILGGDRPQRRAAGRDTDALGPSDSSDSGSDVQGERAMSTGPDQPDELGAVPLDLESDSDRTGTGERASATESVVDSADLLPHRIIGDPTLAEHDLGDGPLADETLDPDDLAADTGGPDDSASDATDGDDENAPTHRRTRPR